MKGKQIIKNVASEGSQPDWSANVQHEKGLFGGYTASAWDNNPKRATPEGNRCASYGYYNPNGWWLRYIIPLAIIGAIAFVLWLGGAALGLL